MIGPTVEQVDAAVRAVLAGLLGPSAPSSPGTIFPGRLLGLRHAEGLVAGSSVVHVGPGTVVTPLARDLLRRSGVEVRLAPEALLRASGDAAEWGFAADSSHAAVGPLRRALLAGPELWHDPGEGLAGLIAWLAGAERRGAVLLTDVAALACWRANRVAGVRAAAATDADAASRAVATLGPNLLAVEPAGRTIHELKHTLAAYRRAGAPRPPAGLEPGAADAHRRGDRSSHAFTLSPFVAERPAGDRPALAGSGPDRGLVGAWRGGGRT